MSFNEVHFRARVDRALESVKRILDNTRNPVYAEEVAHEYQDKYMLVEFLGNQTCAALVRALASVGVGGHHLSTLRAWARERSVTLRLCVQEQCTYDRKEERKVKSDTASVVEVKVAGVKAVKSKEYTVRRVTEHFWNYACKWSLVAFRGTDAEEAIEFVGRTGTCELVTNSEDAPLPKTNVRPGIDVNLTWLLQQLDPDTLTFGFAVDRRHKDCRTPRRNPQVENGLTALLALRSWAERVNRFFRDSVFPRERDHGLNLAAITDQHVFVPVLPLFESREGDSSLRSQQLLEGWDGPATDASVLARAGQLVHATEPATSAAVLPLADLNAFLDEQQRTLSAALSSLASQFPSGVMGQAVVAADDGDGDDGGVAAAGGVSLGGGSGDKGKKGKKGKKKGGKDKANQAPSKLITVAEAEFLTSLHHIATLCAAFRDGVHYVESMLRAQLIAAIGKEVSATDFGEYMAFHLRKLFRSAFQPRPFSYAIRRPGHCPEGELCLEVQVRGQAMAEPVPTIVNRRVPGPDAPCMGFALNAATRVEFRGPQYLHAWVSHAFSGDNGGATATLGARANEFSSFIVLVGRIGGPLLFQPSAAMIVQNKDDFRLPLDLESIPTPKEFRDAIESLSPEQQRFAQAYRAMQLEGTLFGIVVIQIKPQLEKLLKLPPCSLIKEIRLCRDLQELFMEYQIPPDMLTYDGPEDASAPQKVERVKELVAAMMQMIQAARDKELTAAKAKQELELAQLAVPINDSLDLLQEEMMCTKAMSLAIEPLSKNKSRGKRDFKRKKSKSKKSSAKPLKKMVERASSNSAAAAPSPSLPQPAPSPQPPAEAPAPSVVVEDAAPASEASTTAAAAGEADEDLDASVVVDYTAIPAALDAKMERYDDDAALRPIILNVGSTWSQSFKASLLSKPEKRTLDGDAQKAQKTKAFDLLDSLSRSGCLPIDSAELHIVLASCHNFDRSVVDTIVKDNVNPIEKVERSLLIVATTIHDTPAVELVKDSQRTRVIQYSAPLLFDVPVIGEAMTQEPNEVVPA